MKLQYMPPSRRMFLGLVMLAGGTLGGAACIALTIAFVIMIGFIPTVAMYLLFLLAIMIVRIVKKVQRMGHKYRTVREWDTDNADLEGSTARYGLPHDHGSFMSRRKNLDGRP
jgi:hypothetical protein